MPSKYRMILELASQTAKNITTDADRYTDFLITAANNYKYSFKEQLLIHAQKPDATACAEIDTWNKLGRWVNKGTKGIALLIDRDVPYKLRHVFDISDTNSRAGRNITLWQMKPEYEQPVSESLQASFGDVTESKDFPHLLIDISGYAVEDNLSDYLTELNVVKAGSFLEELDDTSLEAWLKTTLKSSVAFMALSRAGYEPRQYFDREDFSHLFDFNTVEVISVLGAAVSDISEMVIREMGETVKEMEKEEKRKIRTFAQTGTSAYHKSQTENKERSNEYGTDVYDAGRLPDSRSDRAGEPEAWEVWNAAANLPPRAPGWDLHRDAAERNAEQPSGGSGPASAEDAGRPDRADEGAERSDRAAESGEPDAVGADDELHSSLGGGSDSERPDLRITLPTVEQQQKIIAEAEEEKSSAFAISQEDIDAILTQGSGIHHGKFRIYEQFLKQDSSENNIAFLKNEYGVGGAYPAVPGRNLDEDHDAKGIKISRGRISQPDAELLLRWNKVEKRIGELIRADRYLSQAEKDSYPAYREQAEARRKRGEISEEFRSIVYDYNDFVTQLGEESKALNLYYLSSCWSAFGAGDKKMHARTAKGDFILPMMREAMNTIIADNTHLTARCEAMLEALNSDVAKPLEPTYDELNPPPEPRKEYRYHLGDTVYIGTQEYELLSFDEKKVVLFDTQFPLFNKELSREEFDNRLKENPLNDIFLQKRDRLVDIEPDWVHLATNANGIRMNAYFVDNPEMVLGGMQMVSGPHGMESACIAYENAELGDLLRDAIQNIHAEITELALDDIEAEEDLSIPADPDVRNFSFTVVDGKIYYRENSRMNPVDVSATAESRIKGMIAIRDCVRTLIEYQTEDYPDADIKAEQEKLNRLYDDFSKKYGLISARANNSAFNSDSSYCLLASLEVLDDEGNFIRKADMFSKRTIKQKVTVQSVDTASEAYALSLAEKARVDMPYMSQLTSRTEQELFEDLKGVIFLNPMHTSEEDGRPKYLPADEYLSGNVREKLAIAKRSAELHPEDYGENVRALEAVQPVDLTASEISVRLGATWLPPEIVEQFMFELFSTPRYCQWNIHVHYAQYTGEWNVEGKSYDRSNVKAHNTYGTGRVNGYKIMEETLNLRDVRIFDYIEDGNGKKTAVLNKKETAIAQGKQELIKQAFADWIWNDPERRERLTKLYNEKFNSIRPREYDGSHLNFVGINPEITLRPHQVNAIAHILYGGNTLLAHVVGAGKTFEMVAAAQESKRLGLCQKSLFVVPNHLTEQWASEYLQLYPSANILVATKKDFETKNRKKFCGRIATGDYDAVIIGHSQFEKIPMSLERQRAILQQQLDEVLDGISELKKNRGDNFSIKQLERTKKTVKQKLDKLNDQSRKDDVVTFEELGVDRIFIDEAHYYKNLAAFTKMRNVGGISQTEAMKSSDLYMKCRYLDELTGGRGVVFATGTPISNSMVEMYTMQKYLQYGALRRNDLLHFDAWASTFGETVTAIELSPEGTGYRAKTRFAKFYNLPELMAMFKETADIQTADMLKLPVPEAHYHSVVLKPSETQKDMVASLSERAERVRNKMVDSSVDNMLLITNDGRKLALDQRLMNDMLPDSETSKVGACAENVFDIWQRTADRKSTQMVFCDLSTPHGDGKFNVYDDLRDKLIAKGVPAEEIAYIHTANSEAQKKELFGKVRSGQVRVLIGSTQKMGAGTNVQTKLAALHHLDCPWRPSDLQQREGRIIRQGNENKEVDIYTYVTENTFDSYLYQLVESKQKFIGQIMTSKSPVRSAEDIDETALSYAEIKALCAGNPHIKEKMDLDIDVSRLKLLKANHLSQRYSLEDQILKEFPQKIKSLEQRIEGYRADIDQRKRNTEPNEDGFSPMFMPGGTVREKKAAGDAILGLCKSMTSPDPIPIGQYRGFDMELSFDTFSREYKITLIHQLRHTVTLGTDIFGNIQRLDNTLAAFEERMAACVEQLENTRVQLENAKVEVQKPFPQEEELAAKTARLNELNALLNLDKAENEIVDGERADEEPSRSGDDRER